MPVVELANLILIVHALFIAVVVFSVPLIISGGIFRWRWVRSPWFRLTHLTMIGFVALEAVIGMACPLTVWEAQLRRGQETADPQQEFIAHWLDKLLFYHFPHWVFTATYITFGLLVAGLFYFVPVRWGKQKCMS